MSARRRAKVVPLATPKAAIGITLLVLAALGAPLAHANPADVVLWEETYGGGHATLHHARTASECAALAVRFTAAVSRALGELRALDEIFLTDWRTPEGEDGLRPHTVRVEKTRDGRTLSYTYKCRPEGWFP